MATPDPLDISTIQNMPATLPPVEEQKLEGEVKAGASHPDQEESVSVLQNKPEEPAAPMNVAVLTGEIPAGANAQDMVPPSLLGTSYDPERAPPTPPTP